jgi:hypothetical protein
MFDLSVYLLVGLFLTHTDGDTGSITAVGMEFGCTGFFSLTYTLLGIWDRLADGYFIILLQGGIAQGQAFNIAATLPPIMQTDRQDT